MPCHGECGDGDMGARKVKLWAVLCSNPSVSLWYNLLKKEQNDVMFLPQILLGVCGVCVHIRVLWEELLIFLFFMHDCTHC